MRTPKLHPALVYPSVVFAVIFVAIFLLHAPLLQLPYFWDEAGYYVAAARDLLLTGSLIPHTTVSNAHPPLVMAWVALWWKVAGYAPLVTRSAMLVVSAFSLLGLFRLAQRAANTEVAIASTLCTALYPVFFAQSSLAQVDLAAAGLTFWALCAYLEDRPVAVAAWFSLAALAKETAILAPLALAAWELVRVVALRVLRKRWTEETWLEANWPVEKVESHARPNRSLIPLLVPLVPLVVWYAYHYARTGYVFGNPEFFRYNVAATLSPLRVFLALAARLWQTFGYMHLWVLTLAMLLAMLLPPIRDDGEKENQASETDHGGTGALARPVAPGSTALASATTAGRQPIPITVQMVFYVVIAAYVAALALIGGAVLARYMLTAVPLVIIVAVSTLRRRLRYWPAVIAVVACAFILGWFWNPPYGFSPEDNLAYRDFIVLHQDGERFLEARYPMARALTAWPASDELTSPWLGYVTRPMKVVRIEDFSLEQVLSAAEVRDKFDVALVFSTKYEPAHPMLDKWRRWTKLKAKYFGFHRDLPPAAAAQILGGHIVFSEERKGQWIAVIEMEKSEMQNAETGSSFGSFIIWRDENLPRPQSSLR